MGSWLKEAHKLATLSLGRADSLGHIGHPPLPPFSLLTEKQLVKIERTTANLCRRLISFIFIQYRWFPLHESSLSMRGSYIWSSREAEMTRESRESASGAFTRWHFQPPCSTVTLALRVAAARAGNYVWPASGARSLLPVPGSGPAQGFPRRHSSNYPGNRRGSRQEAAAR